LLACRKFIQSGKTFPTKYLFVPGVVETPPGVQFKNISVFAVKEGTAFVTPPGIVTFGIDQAVKFCLAILK
jgi:hypothetical protein